MKNIIIIKFFLLVSLIFFPVHSVLGKTFMKEFSPNSKDFKNQRTLDNYAKRISKLSSFKNNKGYLVYGVALIKKKSFKERNIRKNRAEMKASANYAKLISNKNFKGLSTVDICEKTINGQNLIVVKKFAK